MTKHPLSSLTFFLWFFSALFTVTGWEAECIAAEKPIVGIDDLGRNIVLPKIPERIVVLSSSSLDTLFKLGRSWE